MNPTPANPYSLTFTLVAALAFILVPPVVRGQTAPPAQTTPPANENNNNQSQPTEQAQIVQLAPFDVTGETDKGYNTVNSEGATGFNSPIMETPMSIVVLNQQFMQDVGAIDIADAADYVSGVSGSPTPGGGGLTVRGGGTQGGSVRDGIVDPISGSADGTLFSDAALLDRIEVIKGPEGVLYGDFTGQGGLVNVVTKRPQSTPMTSFEYTYGADDLGGTIYRGVFDTTGPVPNNSNLTYRLVVVGQQGTTLQDIPDNRFIVSPMLLYKFGGGGSLLVRYTGESIEQVGGDQWLVDATGHISTFISPREIIGEPDMARKHNVQSFDADFIQPFRTGKINWTARYYFRFNHLGLHEELYEPAATQFLFLNAAGATIGNITNTSFSNPALATIEIATSARETTNSLQETTDNVLNLLGEADFGPVHNAILISASDYFQSYINDSWSGNYPGQVLWSTVPGKVIDYHFPDPAAAEAQYGTTNLSTDENIWTGLLSAGVQDNVSFWDNKVNLVAGVRNDDQNQTLANYFTHSFVPGTIRSGVTKKYGVVIRPVEPVSLFYNLSQTFSPQGGTTNANGVTVQLPNLVSTINEEGVKLSLFQSKLDVTTSYFETVVADATVLLSETNQFGSEVAVEVPAGQEIIKGWESDGTYHVNDNFDIGWGLGNLTSKTQTGLAARGIAFGTTYKALAKYTFSRTFLQGAYLGGGLQHNGARAADAADDAILPAYTVVNAFVGYKWGPHWSCQVNVNNVFDAVYAIGGVSRELVWAGMPTTAQVSVRYSY